MLPAEQLPLPQLHVQRTGRGHHQADLDADHGAGHDHHGASHDDHATAADDDHHRSAHHDDDRVDPTTSSTTTSSTTTSSTTTTSTTVILPAATPAAAEREPANPAEGALAVVVLGGMGYGGYRLLRRARRTPHDTDAV